MQDSTIQKKLLNSVIILFILVVVSGIFFLQLSGSNKSSKAVSFPENKSNIQFNRNLDNIKKALDFYQQAQLFEKQKRYEEAIEYYTQTIALDPKHVYAYINRGVCYNQLNKYDLAIQDYNKALQLNPQNLDALNDRGFSYAMLNDFDAAFKDFTKVIELNPTYLQAYQNRGGVYQHKNMHQEAISDYTQAISLDTTGIIHYQRSISYAKIEDYKNALEDALAAQKFGIPFLDSYINEIKASINF